MTELLTAAQMRAIEQAAIASGEATGLELMERAGRGVVEAIFEEWPDMKAGSFRAVVLCGPGGNGGDGFVVARLLKEWGWEVEVFLCGDPEKMPPDARVNYERWRGMGEVCPMTFGNDADDAVSRIVQAGAHFLIDALFGIGLSRPLEGANAAVLRSLDDALDECVFRYVALDMPSGLCADSGKPLGRSARRADLTVTFHRPKPGHFLAEGPFLCHRLAVRDIGLPAIAPKIRERITAIPGAHPLVKKVRLDAHKYTHGHALLFCGPSGRGGAARLAARGALRIGAGVVTVGCPPDALVENAARLDAIMLRPVADAEALARLLEDGRIKALCLGPGMGTGAREAGLVAVALGLSDGGRQPLPLAGREKGFGGRAQRPGAIVLDADALTILAQNPELFAALHESCILTPHAGEFARLFPDIADKLEAPATRGPAYSKVDATREAAVRAGCTVLYKGPDTVIASPDGPCAINSAAYERAAPWLATAGSGDVLAGFITGLLARGFSPFEAACTGAWLHVECALSFGPGLIAEDLPEALPKVLRALDV